MNDNCKNLLVNCICYIARFTDDRPIIETPSGFVTGQKWIRDRDRIARLTPELFSLLPDMMTPELFEQVRGKNFDEVQQWFQSARPYIRSNSDGLFCLDDVARSFATPPAEPEFLANAILALHNRENSKLARQLLERYVPDGPSATASANEWEKWWKENRDYLFFSDTGGYRWYIDPLAKARGIPTSKLVGPERATLQAVRN